ncbi:MAG: hypothetical protein AAB531_03415 [Patescibacteria group bacterium]
MRKILLSAAFFTITPLLLFVSIVYLSYFSYQKGDKGGFLSKNNSVAFAALPTADITLEDRIISKDSRVESLREFFQKNNSPLEPHSASFIDAARKYDLDFRLLPAIAMQESNLCKKAPKDSYNCWGFGMYGKKVVKFSNFEEAIESVSKTLSKNYKEIGLVTPEQIMSKYTPSNQGDWAESVNYFMNQL